MLSFFEFLKEEKEKKSIHYFDIDDTLSHPPHDLRIHVNDHTGKRVASLGTQEFNKHRLDPGHSYDFHEFRSSEHFKVNPIRPMLSKLKNLARRGEKTEILTARSDFDDKEKFAQKWSDHGVDIMGTTHVRRAGNLGMSSPDEAKKEIIKRAIDKHGYTHVHLYDDHKGNIDSMLSLKSDPRYSHVNFHGKHVEHLPDGKIRVTKYKA